MKFKNKETGVILEPTNKFVIEQLKAQPEKYQIVTAPAAKKNDGASAKDTKPNANDGADK